MFREEVDLSKKTNDTKMGAEKIRHHEDSKNCLLQQHQVWKFVVAHCGAPPNVEIRYIYIYIAGPKWILWYPFL